MCTAAQRQQRTSHLFNHRHIDGQYEDNSSSWDMPRPSAMDRQAPPGGPADPPCANPIAGIGARRWQHSRSRLLQNGIMIAITCLIPRTAPADQPGDRRPRRPKRDDLRRSGIHPKLTYIVISCPSCRAALPAFRRVHAGSLGTSDGQRRPEASATGSFRQSGLLSTSLEDEQLSGQCSGIPWWR